MDFVDENAENETKKISAEKVKKKVVINDNDQIQQIESQDANTKGHFRQNFEATTWLWRISVISFLIGYLFQVLSYGTPYWLAVQNMSGEDFMTIGIWSACFSISNCSYRNEISGCVNSVRVFGGIGIVCGLVVSILLFIYLKQPDNRRCLALSSATLCFVSALSNQISTAVFGRTLGCYYTDDIASMSAFRWTWSIALAFTSVLLTVASGLVFLILELKEISRQKKSSRPWNGRGMTIT